eukprot:Nk52_evm22s2449 gene=Nk52_evmTU22s2449
MSLTSDNNASVTPAESLRVTLAPPSAATAFSSLSEGDNNCLYREYSTHSTTGEPKLTAPQVDNATREAAAAAATIHIVGEHQDLKKIEIQENGAMWEEEKRKKKRRCVWWIVLALLLVVLVALSVGLGVGLGLNDSEDDSSGNGGEGGNETPTVTTPSSFSSSVATTTTTTVIMSTTSTSSPISSSSSLAPSPSATSINPDTSSSSAPSSTLTPGTSSASLDVLPSYMDVSPCGGQGQPVTGANGQQTCQCYTEDYGGSQCETFKAKFSYGTQPNQWNGCTARPDADPKLIIAVMEWVCDVVLREGQSNPNRPTHDICHDVLEATGIFQRLNVWSKSLYVIGWWWQSTRNPQTSCESLRGYLDETTGKFVPSSASPSIAMQSGASGPTTWPGTFVVPAGLELCPAGVPCCLPKVVENPLKEFKGSWAQYSVDLQRLCGPRYEIECNAPGDIDCSAVPESKLPECNCLPLGRDKYDGLKVYTGKGMNCTSITPGGQYVDKWDMYRQLAFASQQMFSTTGECEWDFEGTNDLELCINNEEGTKCKINFTPGLYTDWNGYYPGGRA